MIDFTAGAARVAIAAQDVETLRSAGALIEDARRERPRYFDGRFLAARDLIRDQQYFLAREADLGHATGGGVAIGLRVARGGGADDLLIELGHGITPAGELTLLPRTLSLRLADIPLAEQLSARFGLSRRPQPPLRSRTGLFVLALRPVEFTANPIGAYPSSITGQRTVEDGDVIEGTAVVLVPWTDDNASDALDARRSRAARAIFVDGKTSGVSANVLPLAMVALQNNIVAWLDVPMVRRELGADRADLPGLGVGARALRLSHLLQYQQQLAEMLAANGGRGFAAATQFGALPPAGPMPAGMINANDFTQNFFAAEIDCELAPIPQDELPALIDEALALPALDLELPAEMLDATAVLILAPVPRSEWRATHARLQQTSTDTRTRRLLPAASNRLAARKPLEILQKLRLPRPLALPVDTSDPREREWARLAALPQLWFVRRRNLAYREDLPGAAVPFAGVDGESEDGLLRRLDDNGLRPTFDTLLGRASTAGAAELTGLLASRRFTESPALTAAALGDLARAATLDRATVLAVSAKLAQPGVGEGIVKLEKSEASVLNTPEALKRIATDADWRVTDGKARAADVSSAPGLAAGLAGVRLPMPPARVQPAVTPDVVKPASAATSPKPASAARAASTKPAATASATSAKPVTVTSAKPVPATTPIAKTPIAKTPSAPIAKPTAKAAVPKKTTKTAVRKTPAKKAKTS
jgi:hypothetical protein